MENVNKSRLSHRARLLIIIGAASVAVLTLVIAFAVYVGTYYRADDDAIDGFISDNPSHYREYTEDGMTVFSPAGATSGFVFYPGGKVEAEAYLPLMHELASRGILTVLVEMPFNLAVFDINAAEDALALHPEIESWYIGGHSLGGSMAAAYLEKNTDKFQGAVLLASYSTADLSDSELRVLSVRGSHDLVLNMEKYSENMDNLPTSVTERVIEGGNHAGFGMYGKQKGDGDYELDFGEQIIETAKYVSEFIKA